MAVRPWSHAQLKAAHRATKSDIDENLNLRIHRALSWIEGAERAEAGSEYDTSFIFLWIAFNAIYSGERLDGANMGEREVFRGYFGKIIELDKDSTIYNAIWIRFSDSIRVLLNNRYVFLPFWKSVNGEAGYEDWQSRFESNNKHILRAMQREDTVAILSLLFDRLYVLRNQLIHGGSTRNSSVNRSQVRDGAQILGFLVPIFVELMMRCPKKDWGKPYYPVVN